MRARFPARLGPALVLALTAACSNAGEDLGLPPLRDGSVQVAVFLDRDGSGNLTTNDTIVGGARVGIFVEGGIDSFRVGNTAADGIATFTGLPIGRYRYAIGPASLGDTLPVLVDGTGAFTIRADTLARAGAALASYATLSIEAARQAQAGRRVFVHGVVTSPLQFFADSAMFIRSGGRHLRITAAQHRPGRNGNNLGDSVVVLGTTGSDAGQPVLLGGRVLTLGVGPAPAPEEVSVAELRTARGGALDAALVRVSGAKITDTATVGAEWHVWITDTLTMADTARVVFDAVLQVTKPAYVPGRRFISRGVLVPAGSGSWFLKPRPVAGEVLLF